jgi:hypothetical protein
MSNVIGEPEKLRAIAVEQAATLKLTHLPVSRLVL